MKAKLPQADPWRPAEYELADVVAIKSLFVGEATADQQRRAMKWIVETVCCTYDLSYRPSHERDTVFAEGKRFVGLQLVKALRLNTEVIRRTE